MNRVASAHYLGEYPKSQSVQATDGLDRAPAASPRISAGIARGVLRQSSKTLAAIRRLQMGGDRPQLCAN